MHGSLRISAALIVLVLAGTLVAQAGPTGGIEALSAGLQPGFVRPGTPTPAPEPTRPSNGGVIIGRSSRQGTRVRATPTRSIETPPTPPTSQQFPEERFSKLEVEQQVGEYTVRLWMNDKDDFSIGRIAVISAPGREDVKIEQAYKISSLTGIDINNDGSENIAIEVFTGGAHCCFSFIVYDVGPTLTKILESRPSNCEGVFEDLNGDHVLEFETCDDAFAYKFCCFASSPLPRIVMEYDPARQTYVPASPRFAESYATDIRRDQQRAAAASPGGQCEDDDTTKCGVLPLVLDYVYSGQRDKAVQELGRYYRYPDLQKFRDEILQTVEASPLYVPQ